MAYDLYGRIAAANVDGRSANLTKRTDRHRLAQLMLYGFSGRRHDAESELMYHRTRYYSPEIGRFISVDSIEIWGDLNNYGNGYGYVGNMANSLSDPKGEGPGLNTVVQILVDIDSVALCGEVGEAAQNTVKFRTEHDYERVKGMLQPGSTVYRRNHYQAWLDSINDKGESLRERDPEEHNSARKRYIQNGGDPKDYEELSDFNIWLQKIKNFFKRHNPAEEDNTSAAEILVNGWFHLLRDDAKVPNIIRNCPPPKINMHREGAEILDNLNLCPNKKEIDPDDILSGTIGNMFRRSSGSVYLNVPTGEVSPIRILEDGTVFLDLRGMRKDKLGVEPSQWDSLMQLLFKVDPNLGGAVDPAPIEAAHVPYAYEPAPGL